MRPRPPKSLSPLEQELMQLLWARPQTADELREAYLRPLKDSTIRTLLKRLEVKGYVTRSLEGRSFVYRGAEPRAKVAARTVRHILDRFLDGSVEQLLTGLVENEVVDSEELKRLAAKVARAAKEKAN